MPYEVNSTPFFERETKPLLRKCPSLRDELTELAESLSQQPFQGDPVANNCYKVRLGIKSKGRGKSGARVITCVYVADQELILVSIYDKSDQSSVTMDVIKARIARFRKSL